MSQKVKRLGNESSRYERRSLQAEGIASVKALQWEQACRVGRERER